MAYGWTTPELNSAPSSSGLLSSAMTTTATTPKQPELGSAAAPTSAVATPVQRQVDPAKETVQGQMSGLMAADSPYMQQARTRAAQAMNGRGLLNSSMAIGAGESAAYDAALPIAQADAQIYGNASNLNTQTMNDTAKFNAGEQNKFGIAQMDQNTKLGLADIEANYKTLMQANSSAGQLYQQTVKNITDLINNKDLDATARQTAIDQQTQMLKTGLGMFGKINNLDLTSLLTF